MRMSVCLFVTLLRVNYSSDHYEMLTTFFYEYIRGQRVHFLKKKSLIFTLFFQSPHRFLRDLPNYVKASVLRNGQCYATLPHCAVCLVCGHNFLPAFPSKCTVCLVYQQALTLKRFCTNNFMIINIKFNFH